MSGSDPIEGFAEEIEISAEQCAEIDRLHELARDGTHYELLGVAPDSDSKAIQQAYYELSRQWHPDRFFRKQLGEYGERLELVFIAIADAYRVLNDDARRTVYDMEQGGRGARRGARPTPPPPPRPKPPAEPAPVYEVALERRARPAVPDGPGAGASGASPSASSTGSTPSGAARRRRRRRRSFRTKGLAKVREQMLARLKRGRQCYLEGKAEYEAGNVVKASAALALAGSLDPKNAEYAVLNATVQREARRSQATQYVVAAENAETYRNIRDAMANWRKAIEYDPDAARPHYQLGKLVWRYEDDLRSAVQYLRQAVQADPKNIEYRMTLGDAYMELDLKLNARREYQAVLNMDKSHSAAKEGLKRAR